MERLFFLSSGRVVRYGSNTKEYGITKDGQKNDRGASQYSRCISIKQGKKSPVQNTARMVSRNQPQKS